VVNDSQREMILGRIAKAETEGVNFVLDGRKKA